MSARDAARRYLARGWVPIPLRPGTKQPISAKWERLTRGDFDIDRLFPRDRELNVGISLGEPSGWLSDVDLDCGEARGGPPRSCCPTPT